MFGLSFEHFLIIGVALLIFGPKRLPELGSGIGKAIKNFKDSFSGTQEAQSKKIEGSPTDHQVTHHDDNEQKKG
ncbi:MAG: twin-arginine translocase TatA/TatE family subunit [Bdellovibrionales bacterium]|nr:twin-arginine translocase TatA/TatE family subunit [Bdellovibrionales bacterium]